MRGRPGRDGKWVAEVPSLGEREPGLDVLSVRLERAQPDDGKSQGKRHEEHLPRPDA